MWVQIPLSLQWYNNITMEKEKCHYCDKEALYTDAIEYAMIAVCKDHLQVEFIS